MSPPSAPNLPRASSRAPRVELRPLRTQEELRACVRLQKETWGEDFGEIVPPSILKVCQRVGGVAAGAFDEEGRMFGFVFGLTGVERGRIVHWSDMLAVRAEARDLGLGRRLKEYQRDLLLPLGVEVIYWTFDPLVARNAHLNFARLGVEAVEYVEDMYGESDSDLHRGLGTDRLVVGWWIRENTAPPRPPIDLTEAAAAPLANAPGGAPSDAPLLRVEIPADIQAVKRASPGAAAAWRRSSRAALVDLLGRGYRVAGFSRDPAAGRSFYLLHRP